MPLLALQAKGAGFLAAGAASHTCTLLCAVRILFGNFMIFAIFFSLYCRELSFKLYYRALPSNAFIMQKKRAAQRKPAFDMGC